MLTERVYTSERKNVFQINRIGGTYVNPTPPYYYSTLDQYMHAVFLDNGTTSPNNLSPSLTSNDLVCSDGFFFDKNVSNCCLPTCGEFLPVPYHIQIIQDIAICLSIIVSVMVIIIMLTVQRSSM